MTPPLQKPSIIVCASHSFNDPLFNALIYQYVLGHQENHPSEYIYHIFTEEQAAYTLSPAQQAEIHKELKQKNIFWHPMPYRGGKFILFKKLWNFIVLFFKIWGIRRREKSKLIIGSLALAGGYIYMLSRVFNFKTMVFCFEPHSEYMREFGIWSEKSLKYKILNKVEILEATKCDYVTAPTIHTVQLLKDWQSKSKVFHVPLSVNTDKFSFSEIDRQRIRKQYNIPEDRYLLLYLGKFGGIYYDEKAVAAFCKRLVDFDPRIFMLTISPNPLEEIKQAYLEAGLQESDFLILYKIPFEEVKAYICACDMGMVAIPPLPSQKYRSPIKIGEYLACGIPFIINKGIADDDILAENEQVGVVFKSLDANDFEAPLQTLKALMNEDKTTLRNRCRAAAVKHRGIHNSVELLTKVVDEVYSS